MFIKAKDIIGSEVNAVDGTIGKVEDLLFDDESWGIRYFVINTGGILDKKLVLISPLSYQNFRSDEGVLSIDLTREKVEQSPDIDFDRPISRQRELQYFRYYNWMPYWGYTLGLWHQPTFEMGQFNNLSENEVEKLEQSSTEDEHLRSFNELKKYNIYSSDDHRFGHVEDLFIGDESFYIRYLELDTINWFPSKSVLVSPKWAGEISWSQSYIRVNFTKDKVKNAPAMKSEEVDRSYEEKLYKYFGRTPYWEYEHPIHYHKENNLGSSRTNQHLS